MQYFYDGVGLAAQFFSLHRENSSVGSYLLQTIKNYAVFKIAHHSISSEII
jgi:hypothetical protein